MKINFLCLLVLFLIPISLFADTVSEIFPTGYNGIGILRTDGRVSNDIKSKIQTRNPNASLNSFGSLEFEIFNKNVINERNAVDIILSYENIIPTGKKMIQRIFP